MWFSVADIATLLGVSQAEVRRWIGEGQLTAHKFGYRTVRVQQDDLNKYLAATRV